MPKSTDPARRIRITGGLRALNILIAFPWRDVGHFILQSSIINQSLLFIVQDSVHDDDTGHEQRRKNDDHNHDGNNSTSSVTRSTI